MSVLHKVIERHVDIVADRFFWGIVKYGNIKKFEDFCLLLLSEFGTTNRCNRFDVGNCIELAFKDFLEDNHLFVEQTPHSDSIDLVIENYGNISIKYSKKGDIKIHNSLGLNSNMNLPTTIVIRPDYLYLISPSLLTLYGIDYRSYLRNSSDGLVLLGKLLTKLKKNDYQFMRPINIQCDTSNCLNKNCYTIIYNYIRDKIEKQDITCSQ